MEISTEKSKIMTNSTNINADISINGQKLGVQSQVLGKNPVQKWRMLSRVSHQDCLSNGSKCQTKQDLTV